MYDQWFICMINSSYLRFIDHVINTAVQSQKAVSAYFRSKQILPFGFAERNSSYLRSIVYMHDHIVSKRSMHSSFELLYSQNDGQKSKITLWRRKCTGSDAKNEENKTDSCVILAFKDSVRDQ